MALTSNLAQQAPQHSTYRVTLPDGAVTTGRRQLPPSLLAEAGVAEHTFSVGDRLATPLAGPTQCGQLLAKGDEAGIAENALAVADRVAAPLAAPFGAR